MKQLFLACIFVLMTTFSAFAGVNINTSDQAGLESLPGIGPAKANAIISYRASHGQFKAKDDLLMVKGIGPKLLKKIEQDIDLK